MERKLIGRFLECATETSPNPNGRSLGYIEYESGEFIPTVGDIVFLGILNSQNARPRYKVLRRAIEYGKYTNESSEYHNLERVEIDIHVIKLD